MGKGIEPIGLIHASGAGAAASLERQRLTELTAIGEERLGQEGGRVLAAVLATEGAIVARADRRDIGDHGQSYGPLQFYAHGELAHFAQDHHMSLNQAGEYVRSHPREAVTWAVDGYLGRTIRAGLAAGLRGPELATYAQRRGQRSVAPERAGLQYERLFAGSERFAATVIRPKTG